MPLLSKNSFKNSLFFGNLNEIKKCQFCGRNIKMISKLNKQQRFFMIVGLASFTSFTAKNFEIYYLLILLAMYAGFLIAESRAIRYEKAETDNQTALS